LLHIIIIMKKKTIRVRSDNLIAVFSHSFHHSNLPYWNGKLISIWEVPYKVRGNIYLAILDKEQPSH
jgi:hypothetical protein